ncbi:Mov34/MPN/PAD-1 family protein [Vibrio nigripulchritudo]|uniref:Mov34/MPN/PAD-1 family protein n=1 Tax=Vibrio nigripulchritudo TaxID=28173 RepID=UPI00190CE4E9|nr:Mov34/MPN/PAD-1 family protein [Vibrio nigripulchritudo]
MHEPLIMTYKDRKIVVEPSVLIEIAKFRQCRVCQPEQGGTLIGEWRKQHMRVTGITRPQPQDKASRFSFERCGRTHSKLIRKHWKESGENINYLGEWHTHPELNPTPSGIDKRNWKQLSGPDPVLLMIQGTSTIWWGLLISGRFEPLS